MQPPIQNHQCVIWAMIAAYLIITTFAESYYSKYMRTADAHFRGDNLIPGWAAGISIEVGYRANFTAYTFVASASLVYVDGLAGIILETGSALVYLIVALVFARPIRQTLPSPLGVIGTFTMLIGALVTILVALPQSTLNRVVTGVSALALLGGGWMIR